MWYQQVPYVAKIVKTCFKKKKKEWASKKEAGRDEKLTFFLVGLTPPGNFVDQYLGELLACIITEDKLICDLLFQLSFH